MRRHWSSFALVGVLVASAGCLVRDSTQTWYLESDGTARWMVLESHVRSDASDPVERDREERTYLDTALTHTGSAVSELTALGATAISSRVLRDHVPFLVVTEGRFASLDELGRRLIEVAGGSGSSRLTRVGDEVEWRLEARFSSQSIGALDALADDFERLTVVLANGRFLAAKNFTLSQDGRVATIVAHEDALELGLKWTTR